MQDGLSSALTPVQRLAALRTRQLAWHSLAWSARSEQLMGGGGYWELYGGVLAGCESSRTLVFRQLPSLIRGIPDKEWSIPDLDFDVDDFTMDPAQDLLVVVNHWWYG